MNWYGPLLDTFAMDVSRPSGPKEKLKEKYSLKPFRQ